MFVRCNVRKEFHLRASLETAGRGEGTQYWHRRIRLNPVKKKHFIL